MKQFSIRTFIVACTSAVLLFVSVSSVYADQGGFWSWLFSTEHKKEVEPVSNAVYEDECGSCHFAYQPGLLPEASWHKLLAADALADHFKENAELDEGVRMQLLEFAVAHSADKFRYKRSRKIMNSLGDDQAPLRITKVPYMERKHKEVYEDVVTKSDKVKSLSYCNKCHQKAQEGIYDDDTVKIPGVGYNAW